MKHGLAVFLSACALMLAGFFGLMVLADKCANDGGNWCNVSPAGDGWVNAQ